VDAITGQSAALADLVAKIMLIPEFSSFSRKKGIKTMSVVGCTSSSFGDLSLRQKQNDGPID
jgi:hypothetical protein